MSCRKISWWMSYCKSHREVLKLRDLHFMFSSCSEFWQSNFRAIWSFWHPISRLRDFSRFGSKTSVGFTLSGSLVSYLIDVLLFTTLCCISYHVMLGCIITIFLKYFDNFCRPQVSSCWWSVQALTHKIQCPDTVECLTNVAKFGPFPCTILYKSCLFYPSWQASSF